MVDRFTTAQSTCSMWRWGPPAFLTLAAMAALTALTADAAARQVRLPLCPISDRDRAVQSVASFVKASSKSASNHSTEIYWFARSAAAVAMYFE
jgi:hypothetical protein